MKNEDAVSGIFVFKIPLEGSHSPTTVVRIPQVSQSRVDHLFIRQ
jgi:hypothetical protein